MTKNRMTSAASMRAIAMLRRRRSRSARSSSAIASRQSSKMEYPERRQSHEPLDHERGKEREEIKDGHAEEPPCGRFASLVLLPQHRPGIDHEPRAEAQRHGGVKRSAQADRGGHQSQR